MLRLLGGNAFVAIPPSTITDPGYDIIIAAGQSNAAGSGLGDPEYPSVVTSNIGDILQLGRFGADDMQLIPAVEPLQHHGREGWPLEYGPALPFAAHLRAVTHVNREIVILPAAKGGTHMLQWNERVDSPAEQVVIYPDMVTRANHLLNLPAPGGGSGVNRVIAFMWQHGESAIQSATDPGNLWYDPLTASQMAQRYAAHLGELMSRVRDDIAGDYPILIGQMLPNWPFGDRVVYGNTFRSAQNQWAAIDDSAKVVVATDMTSNVDDVPGATDPNHFSARSMTRMGQRYYQALMGLAQT